MSKEKQIEKMMKHCPFYEKGKCILLEEKEVECDMNCDLCDFAKSLYNAGYRKQAWISIEERLPEDVYGKDRKQITTLVYTRNGRVSTASRMRIVKWDKTKLEWVTLDTFEWSRGLRVTHWMPLPEAPKMKGGE